MGSCTHQGTPALSGRIWNTDASRVGRISVGRAGDGRIGGSSGTQTAWLICHLSLHTTLCNLHGSHALPQRFAVDASIRYDIANDVTRKRSMPTVLRVGRFRFYFFSNERQEPPHIHVKTCR